jgi:Na+/H+ antiporter NhaD/arsenite permease-like protein
MSGGVWLPPKVIAALTFLIAYVMLIRGRPHPPYVVWSGSILLLALKVITPAQALRSINLNVIGIFIGMMILSDLFIHSQVPAYLACVIVHPKRSIASAVLGVCILSGVVSAFVDNVATVLMIAPIALEISRRLKTTPVPFLIGIAVAANLQGAATLVGDSTSILLASAANMTFADFFWMKGRAGIFFSVQLAAIASFYVLYLVFRRYKGRCIAIEAVRVTSWVPTILMVLMMLTMAASSFIPESPEWSIGAIALAYAAIALVWNGLTGYKQLDLVRDLDWATVFLLGGLFILIGSLTATGLVGDIASLISGWTKGNAFIAYNVIVWMSVVVSAFVDNIPYTMAMLPVAQLVSTGIGASPYVMLFGLLLGTTLGGNITPIGASANVVAVSLLRKQGHKVTFGDFARIGLPFTIAAVLVGSLFNWVVWR